MSIAGQKLIRVKAIKFLYIAIGQRIKNTDYTWVESIIDEINRKKTIAKMSKLAHDDMKKLAGIDKIIDDEIAYMRE